MTIKRFLLSALLAFFFVQSIAQSPGDTIKVSSWQYSSTNRDTIISFPNNPSINFERVIMRYAMRCKGALVSTVSNRNLGCGEWDYSCNTYVHNPLLADSINRSTNRYQITPATTDSIFSSVLSYDYKPKLQLSVVIDSIISESKRTIGATASTTGTTNAVNGSAKNGRSIIHYTASELINAGVSAGNIDGLRIYAATAGSTLKDFRVGVKHSASNPYSPLDTNTLRGFQNVYYHDHSFSSVGNRLHFHTPFNWDGTSDILIELSYRGGGAQLSLWEDTTASAIATADDYALDLFPSNYVEANSYQVIGGNNQRTVEAWIKTTSGGEITSWGSNSTGGKQSFRVINTNGFIRLEINGGYIIGSTPVNDGEWHHVAYTFSGSSLSNVSLYVDGIRETISSINNIAMNTVLSLPLQISKGFHNRYFNGQIDQLRIWSTALNAQTISDWRFKRIDTTHISANSLELAYPITSDSSSIADVSGNQRNATFFSTNSFKELDQTELFKDYQTVGRPFIEFYQGNYQTTVSNDTLMDTIPRSKFIVEERSIIPRPGTTLSDSIASISSDYYPMHNRLFDLNDSLISSTISSGLDTLIQSSLNYQQRNPSKVEIMSFVTPYGINLDLGSDGKAWYFDVSDFMPVLKGNRRMTMERGGQWQEEMDIDFYFIVGTPPAEVKSIREVWKVDSRPYTTINNNSYFAPRTIELDTSASRYKIRSAITGHGQQGEFIPRIHTVTVNSTAFSRSVWKECAENPVYPQGGTWIYDRAGWCPGMSTDVFEYDITSLAQSPTISVDYNVSGATGTSNYIVSTQLVEYGPMNFANDARIENVLRPNSQTEFGRKNPSCYDPVIILKNTGSNTITAAVIELSMNNGTPFSYNWSGSISSNDTAWVVIPVPASFWTGANQTDNQFRARIMGVNNGSDQYVHNNIYYSSFDKPDVLPSRFRLIIKTNNAAWQNIIRIKNESGSVVFSRGGFQNNMTTGNIINLPNGCYQLILSDANDDGLSFFANNAGTGYFRIENMNLQTITNFNPDFGDRVEYYFTVDQSTGLDQESRLEKEIKIYPNPAEDYIQIASEESAYAWSIKDLSGKEVLNGFKNEGLNLLKVDLSRLAKGVYFFQIEMDEEIIIRKLVKQ